MTLKTFLQIYEIFLFFFFKTNEFYKRYFVTFFIDKCKISNYYGDIKFYAKCHYCFKLKLKNHKNILLDRFQPS